MDTLDWDSLSKSINKTDKIAFEPNRGLFTKVAFDVFQLNTSPAESLWKLEEDESGEQFLVAMYDDANAEITVKSNWSTLPDKTAQNITLFYKDTPIQRFASKEFGFEPETAGIFQRTLVEKLSSDQEFRLKFLNSQSEEMRNQLLIKFPEIAR